MALLGTDVRICVTFRPRIESLEDEFDDARHYNTGHQARQWWVPVRYVAAIGSTGPSSRPMIRILPLRPAARG